MRIENLRFTVVNRIVLFLTLLKELNRRDSFWRNKYTFYFCINDKDIVS